MQDFNDMIDTAVTDMRKGRETNAALTLHGAIVDRLTREVRETLDTPAELAEHDHVDDVLAELEMELVIAYADQTKAGVRETTQAIDRFMSAHVRPMKDTIIADVVANLTSGGGASVGSRADNDA